MSKIEVLISTMNLVSKDKLLKEMKINKNAIIINQITKDILKDNLINYNDDKKNIKILSFCEKGLSKSRNKALKNSKADICVIADDDMYYENDFDETIINEFEKKPEADLIAFVVDREDQKKSKKRFREGRVGFLKSLKLSSVQISFRRKSIIDNNILFDESFGAGSVYPWGEENIFLFDCLKRGLKIYYVPVKIATLYCNNNSSWDKSNTIEHYNNQGVIYYRMTHKFYWLLIIQFVIRKRNIYKNDLSSLSVLKSMFDGVKKIKKGK